MNIFPISGDKPSFGISDSEPIYDTVKALLPPNEDCFSSYRVDDDLYYEIEAILFAHYGTPTVEDVTSLERWKKRTYHWDNIDAFNASVASISADRVIDLEESRQICYVLEQWTTQLEEARDYVIEFRRVEPEFVNEPLNGLTKLESEANRGLELLHQV